MWLSFLPCGSFILKLWEVLKFCFPFVGVCVSDVASRVNTAQHWCCSHCDMGHDATFLKHNNNKNQDRRQHDDLGKFHVRDKIAVHLGHDCQKNQRVIKNTGFDKIKHFLIFLPRIEPITATCDTVYKGITDDDTGIDNLYPTFVLTHAEQPEVRRCRVAARVLPRASGCISRSFGARFLFLGLVKF